MSLVSSVYSTKRPLTPINKQSAVGCLEVGSAYDQKPFRPLKGKGLLRWVLKNCRTCEDKQDLIYKIAEGCNVPLLEVVDMVGDWMEKGIAFYKDGKMVVKKRSPLPVDYQLFFKLLPETKYLCQVLKGEVDHVPEFYLARLGRDVYDVAIEDQGNLILFKDWCKSFGKLPYRDLSLRGTLLEATYALFMLRDVFPSSVGIGEGQGGRIYKLSKKDLKKDAYVQSLIKPYKSRRRKVYPGGGHS